MPALSTLTLLLIAGYFALLVLSLVRRGRVISGPWLFLMRSFFPNWRFYHGFGQQPRLFVRSADDDQWSDWQMFMPRARFALGDLWHNPRNNLLLANQNLVDHLSFDIQTLPDGSDVRALASYQLVAGLAETLVAHEGAAQRWQFQVRLVPPLQVPDEEMAVLTSPVMGRA